VIKLLIVDDSALMRRLLTEIFEGVGDFEVATARTGEEAIERLQAFAPDVVTLDIHMPGMDGIACLDRIMLERPCPVVMISSLTEAGAAETLDAMALGAVDFIAKPRGPISLEIDSLAPLLVEKIRMAAKARISRAARLTERLRLRTAQVLVGASTGGPPALDALLGPLPADFPWPILIAQHMPASFTGPLARRLDQSCALHVVEVTAPVALEPGHAYIGSGDADLLVSRRRGKPIAMAAPLNPEFAWHPSVDRLVASAMAQLAPEHLIGVLMTGMGSDGAERMAALKAEGGHTIAQDEETAVVWGMPGALAGLDGADRVLPLDAIAGQLLDWLAR
jgi:two-component system, chemotaxis family, protein-glutamate methylesterase/glutaminase